jgi:hypothetical protein
MEPQTEKQPQVGLAARISELKGLDTTDTCRIRLLSLRTRIESNWPSDKRFLARGRGLAVQSRATILELLVALPTPLPVRFGGEIESIICDTDTDLRAVAGRAVDAGLTLLEGATLTTEYPGQVSMLESWRPGSQEPIVMSEPTVGLLVATIIGTLEAVAEALDEPAPKTSARVQGQKPNPTAAARADGGDAKPAIGNSKTARRGRVVPRI